MDRPRYILEHLGTGAKYREVLAAPRETLYEALDRAGVPIRTTCRASTICGLCWVVVEDEAGLPEVEPDERALLDRTAAGVPRARLGCRLKLPPGQSSLRVRTDYWRPDDEGGAARG